MELITQFTRMSNQSVKLIEMPLIHSRPPSASFFFLQNYCKHKCEHITDASTARYHQRIGEIVLFAWTTNYILTEASPFFRTLCTTQQFYFCFVHYWSKLQLLTGYLFVRVCICLCSCVRVGIKQNFTFWTMLFLFNDLTWELIPPALGQIRVKSLQTTENGLKTLIPI